MELREGARDMQAQQMVRRDGPQSANVVEPGLQDDLGASEELSFSPDDRTAQLSE